MSEYHIPVMLHESVDGLNISRDGIYVDATFGGGGHAQEILNRLGNGKLYAFDQDEDSAANIIDDQRLIFIRHNFRYIKNFLRYYKVTQVDGILADLGVSSHDFDQANRGFSFRFDAPLDMRMNRDAEISAETIIGSYSEEKLKHIFSEFGEIQNARKLAAAIVSSRQEKPVSTTGQLLAVIDKCVPKAIEKKYMAQVFQALRMEVNNEITVLKEFLTDALEVLKPGGRMVVITYHSLEDRIVKNFTKTGNFEGITEQDFFGNFKTPFLLINRKVIIPSEIETGQNPRARSGKLRIAEKL